MSGQSVIRSRGATLVNARLAPTVFGAHIVARTGAPPIRIIGSRIFHHVRGHRAEQLFVSLWSMRSPGYILAHSLPDRGAGARAATSAADLDAATDTLAAYCRGLTRIEVNVDKAPTLDAALQATIFNGRIDAFRILVGQALADWSDRGVVIASTG